LVFYNASAPANAFLIVRIVAVGSIALIVARRGFIGEADGIAILLLVADPAPLSPLPALFAVAAVTLCSVGYLHAKGIMGKDRTITLEQFKSEAKWVPKGASRASIEKAMDEKMMVEVQYGVPLVAYIASGYMIYLVYLAIFQTAFLLALL